MRNQYFQLVFRNNQVFLHIFPPQDGGECLAIGEITAYLDTKGFSGYNVVEIGKAIGNKDEESDVLLGGWNGIAISEMMDVNVSLDKMKVVCRFYPPSAPEGRLLTAKDIADNLTFLRVKYGFDPDAVHAYLKNRTYCTDLVFATGLYPVHGRDAKIEYFFNTSKNLQPKRNEDGSVDYKELNTISHVKAGDVLARLIKEDPGTAGRNVYGDEIKPRTVKTAKLDFGKNITCNEDGTEIVSDVTGHASLINGKVFVSNVYDVPADVDNSTGNIEYDGSVLIHGNVKSGFTVKASQDVIVEGVVEGAEVIAGTQLVIKHGVHGMFKAKLKAGTNMMAKFVENATIEVGGYLETEQLLNSDVSAGGSIQVHGRKGLVNGGTLRARDFIDADTLGSSMGTSTVLEVGVDPSRKERYIALSNTIAEKQKEIEDIKVILTTYTALLKKGERLPQDKILYAQQTAIKLKALQEEIAPMKEEKSAIYQEMMASNRAYVAVRRNIFPGVVVAISDLSMQIREERGACKYKKSEGTITNVPI